MMRSGQLDTMFAALADPTRRAIVSRLAAGDATVSELAEPFSISQPAISRHLRVLEAAGLVEQNRVAQSRPRRLRPEALKLATEWIDQVRADWLARFDRIDTLRAIRRDLGR